MRYVDLYQNNDNKAPIALDCIQTGEVLLTRTTNAVRFTMADGSPCMYTSAVDTATFTLRLECSCQNAENIARWARHGSFVIAGMSYGTNRRSIPTETAANLLTQQTGVTGYITSGVQIKEISASADLYAVSIPIQILVNVLKAGEFSTVDVPAVQITSLVIDDHTETLKDANYRYQPVGTFVRRRFIQTVFPLVSVSCKASIPDGDALYSVIVRENTGMQEVLTGTDTMDGILELVPGRNDFLLTVKKADGGNCKPQCVRFTVYMDDDDRLALRTEDGRLLTTEKSEILTVKEETPNAVL